MLKKKRILKDCNGENLDRLLMSHFFSVVITTDEEDVASSPVMYWMVLVVVNAVSILSQVTCGRIYSKMTHPLCEETKWSLAPIQIKVLFQRTVLNLNACLTK